MTTAKQPTLTALQGGRTVRASELSLPEQLYDAKLARDAAIKHYEDLAARVRDEIGLTDGPAVYGDVELVVRPNRTFDKVAAKAAYGDEICTMQVDLALAKAKLTGDEYDALMKVNKAKPFVLVEARQA